MVWPSGVSSTEGERVGASGAMGLAALVASFDLAFFARLADVA